MGSKLTTPEAGRWTVAIAEDDSQQREMLRCLIERLGCQVICGVGDGEELVAWCQSHEIDVALVDLDMPIVDGLEAAEILAEQGVPIILVPGLPEADHVVVEREPIAARQMTEVMSTDSQSLKRNVDVR